VSVFIGCDHAAVDAKRVVIEALAPLDVKIVDVGTNSDQSVDYPDFALQVGEAVAADPNARGILLCGTGIGMSIAANKVPGVRAALVGDITGATMSRKHNDANVLVLGGGVLGPRLMIDIVGAWMSTDFEDGRHQRRLDKITAIETGRTGSRTGSDQEKAK
jgi:ribose 5-phosphate isomerase B